MAKRSITDFNGAAALMQRKDHCFIKGVAPYN